MSDITPGANVATAKAQTADMVRFKQQMDALKNRLEQGPDEKVQLKKACQDFEAVFISKLWQQMQATVPKEGYLHSPQEKAYLGMFDQAFAEKMSQAGGIGLADMLFEQLAMKLKETSTATVPGGADIKPLAEHGKPDIKTLSEATPVVRTLSGTEPEMPEEIESVEFVETSEEIVEQLVGSDPEAEQGVKPQSATELTREQVEAKVEDLARQIRAEHGGDTGRARDGLEAYGRIWEAGEDDPGKNLAQIG